MDELSPGVLLYLEVLDGILNGSLLMWPGTRWTEGRFLTRQQLSEATELFRSQL